MQQIRSYHERLRTKNQTKHAHDSHNEQTGARQETTTEQHDNAKTTEGPTYVVDGILGHRKDTHGSLEFHVKWHSYNETTSEPHCNIPEELVSRYFTKQARTPRALTVIVDD